MPDASNPPDATDADARERRYVRYDPASECRFSTTLALAVADAAGVHPTDLDPLAYTLDPANLDALVATPPSESADTDLQFAFGGFDVTVHSSGLAELQPRDGGRRA